MRNNGRLLRNNRTFAYRSVMMALLLPAACSGTPEIQSTPIDSGGISSVQGGNGSTGTSDTSVAQAGAADAASATADAGAGALAGANGSGGTSAVGGTSGMQGGTAGNAGGVPAAGGYGGSQGGVGDVGGSMSGVAAGDAGTPCAAASCDDGNPCTTDTCSDSGCSHAPLHDGATCDDRNPCTLNDQCQAGICQGALHSSQAEILSNVPTFGAYRSSDDGPPLQGFAAVLPNDRFLFADRLADGNAGTSLVLTEVRGGQLDVLDTYTSKLIVPGEPGGGLDWTFRLHGFLIPLSQERVALVVAHQGIKILDTSGGKLALVASFPLASQDPIYGAVGRDNRFWTCYPGVEAYSLKDDGTVSASPLGGFSLGTCKSLAISPDGQHLFLSGNIALTSLNVAGDNAIVEHTNTSAGPFGSLAAGDRYVVGIQLFAASGIGDVQVLDASDLSLITTLPRLSSDTPRAVAVSGNNLFVEWNRTYGDRCTTEIDRYALQSPSPVRDLSLTLRDVYCADEVSRMNWQATPLWAQGSYTIVEPSLDVLQWNASSVNALTGPRHGAIESLWGISETELDAVGLDSVHRIDLTDPRQPRFTQGGRTLSRQTNTFRFAIAEHGEFEPRLVDVQTTSAVKQDATSVHLSRLSGGLSTPPVNAGTLVLDGGPATLTSSGGSLFQVAAAGAADFRVRRFGASSGLQGHGDATLSADHDANVSLDGSPEFSDRVAPQIAIDDRNGALVITELRMDPSHAQNTQQLWLWLTFDQKSNQFRYVASGTLPYRVDGIALSQGRLLIAGRTVQVLELNQGQLQVDAELAVDDSLVVRKVLGWDGKRAYVSVQQANGDGYIPVVWVLNGDDLTEIARYELPDEPLSMDSVGSNWVFGMKTGITVAAPACP